MFSRIIKNFFLKRNINKRLDKHQLDYTHHTIKTVGIIVDETYFTEIDKLIEELVSKGVDRNAIEVLHFLDKKKKNSDATKNYCVTKNISWSGQIKNEIVSNFVEKPFDLLINYYDIEKQVLLLITKRSKAKFKVGFETIDKRVNHFMINLPAENYKEFISELFKYLKILKKT